MPDFNKVEFFIAGAVVATFYAMGMDAGEVMAQKHMDAYPAIEKAVVYGEVEIGGVKMNGGRHISRATEWQKRNG